MARSSNKRVRYAVVGLGNIAQVAVLPAFEHAKDNSELVALVSSDPTKLEQLAKRYDVASTGGYDALESIIRQARVDAVYVAVPNALHRELTVRAAAAGAHVLCEKPMAGSEQDCQAMIDATRAAGVKLMIAYRLHFDPANLEAIDLVRSGAIGDPRFLSSVFSQQVREGDVRTRDDLAADLEPEPSAAQGLADVRIIQAMMRSARTGAAVQLAPVEPPARPEGSLAMKKPPVGKVKPVHAPSPSK